LFFVSFSPFRSPPNGGDIYVNIFKYLQIALNQSYMRSFFLKTICKETIGFLNRSRMESTDTDGDGIPDITETDGFRDGIDPYPLTPVGVEPEPGVLEIGRDIMLGAVFGETGISGGSMNWMVGDSIASSPYYLVGWLGFSLVPVAGAVADARDAVQAFINGDELGAALNAAGVFSGLGDAVKVSGAVGTFVVKYPGKISDVGKVLAKYVLKDRGKVGKSG
jgi:hypothetical protein